MTRLCEQKIAEIWLTGLATDHCLKWRDDQLFLLLLVIALPSAGGPQAAGNRVDCHEQLNEDVVAGRRRCARLSEPPEKIDLLRVQGSQPRLACCNRVEKTGPALLERRVKNKFEH